MIEMLLKQTIEPRHEETYLLISCQSFFLIVRKSRCRIRRLSDDTLVGYNSHLLLSREFVCNIKNTQCKDKMTKSNCYNVVLYVY